METLYKRSVKETYIAIGINNWNINTVAITIAKILDFIEVKYHMIIVTIEKMKAWKLPM